MTCASDTVPATAHIGGAQVPDEMKRLKQNMVEGLGAFICLRGLLSDRGVLVPLLTAREHTLGGIHVR